MKNTSNNSKRIVPKKIVIVDYGMGNLRSLQSKIKTLGYQAIVSDKAEDILSATALIFPGVGNFKKGMENLQQKKLLAPLEEAVREKKIPILGICLGMQLFCKNSEEGNVEGLGWIDAQVKKFNISDLNLRVPHVGWNDLSFCDQQNFLFSEVETKKDFYFTHSYQVEKCPDEQVLCKTNYGRDFISGVHRENIFGVQFHPEKSRKNGLKIIENFITHA